MNLGDAFPLESRVRIFRERFQPKAVIKLFCSFTDPPKEKRLLIVSINPIPLFFVINSKINAFKLKRKELLDQQVPIPASSHTFFEHDSYIDCSRVRDDFSVMEIEEIISQDISRMLGVISDDVAANIIEIVTDSVTLEPRYKNLIVSNM